MGKRKTIGVVGSKYGLLIAAKLFQSGADVIIFCTKEEETKYTNEGFELSFLQRGNRVVEKFSTQKNLKNQLLVFCSDFVDFVNRKPDLVFWAISEFYLNSNNLANLVKSLYESSTPTIVVSNLVPPNFFYKFDQIKIDKLKNCYHNYDILIKFFDNKFTTYGSPEPQISIDLSGNNRFFIRLGGAFRIHYFSDKIIDENIKNIILNLNKMELLNLIRIPIEFKFYNSPFVSLSKLPMLMTGNYRCFGKNNELISIFEAVHRDLNLSKIIYNEVTQILVTLGAPRSSLIPFYKYAEASKKLDAPSSVAIAIHKGFDKVERVDLLIITLAKLLAAKVDNCKFICYQIEKLISKFHIVQKKILKN